MIDIPFFSVIIPTFNRADFLSQTIQSVINQKFQNWECIIVDDGSTDNTKEVVNSFNDSRIKYFYKKNEERSIARNYGIQQARGQYICFLDSDDLYYPNHLSSLFTKIEGESFPVAILNTGMNEKRGNEIIKRPVYKESDFSHPIYFIWKKFILINSICVHREILKHHKFPTNFSVWEDTHLWLRIAAQYPFYQIEEVTTQWNVHEAGTVERAFKKVNPRHIKRYLECISNLFRNHQEIITPYLGLEEMRSYQFSKLKMFMLIAFKRKSYITFFRLYIYGYRLLGKQKLNSFVIPLIKWKLNQKRAAIRKLR